MVKVFDNESGALLGELSDEQFSFLEENLEEESEQDSDYYINADTIETFEAEGADPALISLLRKGLGSREEMEIRWSRE